MSWTLRFVAIFFVVGPLAAMLSEPFFEALYDAFGWDTEDLAGPAARWVVSLGRTKYFLPTCFGLIGIGLGVWLHYWTTRADRRRLAVEPQAVRLGRECQFLSNCIGELRITSAPEFEMVRVISQYEITADKLRRLGVPMQSIGDEDPLRDLQTQRAVLNRVIPYLTENDVKGLKRLISSKTQVHADEADEPLGGGR